MSELAKVYYMSNKPDLIAGTSYSIFNLMLESPDFRQRIVDANFHEFSWTPKTSDRRIGKGLSGFTKEPLEYQAVILLSGNESKKQRALDDFHDALEYDIQHEQPGTLYWLEHEENGEIDLTSAWYIEAYGISSSTEPYKEFGRDATKNTVKFTCLYPFWTRNVIDYSFKTYPDDSDNTSIDISKEYQEYLSNNTAEYGNKDYGYNYDYGLCIRTGQTIFLDTANESSWELEIHGPAANPIVQLGDNITIILDYEINHGETIVINSREKTIECIPESGPKINIFGYRNTENGSYIFEKIPSGEQRLEWKGCFGVDLIIFEERSEPKWTA